MAGGDPGREVAFTPRAVAGRFRFIATTDHSRRIACRALRFLCGPARHGNARGEESMTDVARQEQAIAQIARAAYDYFTFNPGR
jgi:hypothetical protein